ncbi:Glutathione import ATP-binding protein GsiA [Corynebacterium ciconiae DSM 44920]|uniref:dipeptide ABC transporter ATP-binding protein n=1 Tax=Corynebacterium ciconiae TaxID=227319 RepID=UPI0003822EBC|nr:ABC transporter ATP-binding protein [Corynebacterium ciconiae]WKD60584.1 Glutathione import ATP-binding protein GsiA [Corynebacterium ciconiae DSM 44920]
MSSTPLLSIEGLSVSYGDSPAVSLIDATLQAGETLAIVGESGSGKTTTAQAIVGLLGESARITHGSIRLNGEELVGRPEKFMRTVRGRRIGLVPQDPTTSFNPVHTIGQMISEAIAIHDPRGATQQRVVELLEKVGVDRPELRAGQYPHELSGGLRQRALIAAAIAGEPELIIADEPTSALDVTVQDVVLDVLADMTRELGAGVVLITHDLAVAGDRADRIMVMNKGKVVETGTSARVLGAPKEDYTQRLISHAPSLHVAELQAPATAVERELVLRVEELSKSFPGVTAVDTVSFTVDRGTTHGLVGESGSGKTTIGRIITMFQTPSSGRVLLGGKEVSAATPAEIRSLRRRIQLVYQNPYSSFDPRLSLGESVAEPLRNFGLARRRRERQEQVAEAFARVHLDPALAARRPRELSGGQLQRAAIARALVVRPELIVLDEAVSALDVTVQSQILDTLHDLQEEFGVSYVFISHDLAVVRAISSTVSVMRRGRQVDYGTVAEVFEHPTDEFTQRLLHAIPGWVLRERLEQQRHIDYVI